MPSYILQTTGKIMILSWKGAGTISYLLLKNNSTVVSPNTKIQLLEIKEWCQNNKVRAFRKKKVEYPHHQTD